MINCITGLIIRVELSKYKEDAAEITKKTGATSLEDLQNDTSAKAQHLKAVSSCRIPDFAISRSREVLD